VKAREVGANGVIIDNSSQVIFRHHLTRHFRRRASDMAVDATRAAGAPAGPPAGVWKDVAKALRQLQKLHQDGVITDREYEQKKTEILRRI
jgi:hypothetical protein